MKHRSNLEMDRQSCNESCSEMKNIKERVVDLEREIRYLKQRVYSLECWKKERFETGGYKM